MKGQNLRIFIGAASSSTKPIAKATNCTVHLGTSTENESTKDDTGDWDKITVVGKNWDISAECEFVSDSDSTAITAADVLDLFGTEVFAKFAPASGDKNRTAGTALLSGNAIITDMSITSQNKTTVTASITLTGNGALS